MANAKADHSFVGWPAMPLAPVPTTILDMLLSQIE